MRTVAQSRTPMDRGEPREIVDCLELLQPDEITDFRQEAPILTCPGSSKILAQKCSDLEYSAVGCQRLSDVTFNRKGQLIANCFPLGGSENVQVPQRTWTNGTCRINDNEIRQVQKLLRAGAFDRQVRPILIRYI
jgi:hypothetical protein